MKKWFALSRVELFGLVIGMLVIAGVGASFMVSSSCAKQSDRGEIQDKTLIECSEYAQALWRRFPNADVNSPSGSMYYESVKDCIARKDDKRFANCDESIRAIDSFEADLMKCQADLATVREKLKDCQEYTDAMEARE